MNTPKQPEAQQPLTEADIDRIMAEHAEKSRQKFEAWAAKVPSMSTDEIENHLDYISGPTRCYTFFGRYQDALREELKKRGIK